MTNNKSNATEVLVQETFKNILDLCDDITASIDRHDEAVQNLENYDLALQKLQTLDRLAKKTGVTRATIAAEMGVQVARICTVVKGGHGEKLINKPSLDAVLRVSSQYLKQIKGLNL